MYSICEGYLKLTISHKAASSLLITVVLFCAFTALAFTGLFDLIEARFYNPSIMASIDRDILRNAVSINGFIEEIETNFSDTLRLSAIRRSFLPNQSAEDIFERSRIYGLFAESTGGVQWIRFIDAGGHRIHYSTNPEDILRQDRLSMAYRNYDDPELLYDKIAVAAGGEAKYLFDGEADRLVFSFPFYDSFDVYRGTAVFSLSIKAVSDRLISEGSIRVNQNIAVITEPPGLLFGMPLSVEGPLIPLAAAAWKEGGMKAVRLESGNLDSSLYLFTAKAAQGFYIGKLVEETLFAFPMTMKIILLASFFLTLYLTIFLLFNLRQDSVTIVQNRLKQLQIALIEQFYDRKADMDCSRWSRELESRRDEINSQLKEGIKKISDSKNQEIDALIDKSWNELLSVMGGYRESVIDEDKLQQILNRILASIPSAAIAAPAIALSPHSAAKEIDAADTPDEAEVLDELEEAEPVEEIIEEIEMIEEPEELAEIIEEAEMNSGTVAGDLQPASEIDMANLASQIEFGTGAEPETHDDAEPLHEDLEILSPFSTMFSDLADADSEAANREYTDSSAPEAIMSKTALILFSRPFNSIGRTEIENLEVLQGNEEEPAMVLDIDDDTVIEEHDGIHYISGETLNSGSKDELVLNKEFKELVDSILK